MPLHPDSSVPGVCGRSGVWAAECQHLDCLRAPTPAHPDDNVIGLPDMWKKDKSNDSGLQWVTWRFEYPTKGLAPEEQAELDAFEAECFKRNEWPEVGAELRLASERRVWLVQGPESA